jgi:hypothetical protein
VVVLILIINIMKKLALIAILVSLVSSCSSYSTHGKFITEHENAWMDGYVPGGKPTYSAVDRTRKNDKGLVFCQANISKVSGQAAPVCYIPKFKKQR